MRAFFFETKLFKLKLIIESGGSAEVSTGGDRRDRIYTYAGRPSRLTPDVVNEYIKLRESGLSQRSCSDKIGFSSQYMESRLKKIRNAALRRNDLPAHYIRLIEYENGRN